MDNLSVVYPQYWFQFDVEKSFNKHLDVIKAIFYHLKKLVDNVTWVPKILLVTSFDIQQSMFKLAMK
jgi:hypothetical protein